jgi:hypothetical protein
MQRLESGGLPASIADTSMMRLKVRRNTASRLELCGRTFRKAGVARCVAPKKAIFNQLEDD